MKRIFLFIISLLFINSCTKNAADENLELNKIIYAVLRYESERQNLKVNQIFKINPELQKLNIYVPSEKEILGEEPGPPPFFSRNIIRLLDLNKNNLTNRKTDSLNFLKQNKYIFDYLQIDKKINTDVKIANKNEIDERENLYRFSNPVYFKNNNFAYIETIFFDSSFGIGFAYLLEKEKNGNWKVLKIENTFIT